jgi:hypothetical protein
MTNLGYCVKLNYKFVRSMLKANILCCNLFTMKSCGNGTSEFTAFNVVCQS